VTVLLDLEPRVAGTDVLEPEVEFASKKWVDLHDRARCLISKHTTTRACADEQ
jgi:hypothetical protein